MPRACTRLGWLVLCYALALLSGCTFGGGAFTVKFVSRSFGILDLRTGRTAYVPREGHAEKLLRTDDRSRTFRTLYLSDNHKHFVMRTISYEGKVLEEREVPIFGRGYVAIYHVQQGYALSPDASSMAYLDEQSAELRLLDLQSGKSRKVMADLATDIVHVHTLEWLSDRELLFAIDGTFGSKARIAVVDVASGAVRVDLRPGAGSLLAGVKTDGAYLAYRDYNWNRRGFRIYDLRQAREIGEVIPGPDLDAGFERWSTDGEPRLLYIESTRDCRCKLKQYDVARKESKALKSWDEPCIVYICGTAGTKVFYKVRPFDPIRYPPSRLFVWDAATQTESEIKGVKTAGTVRIVDGGNRVIYQP